MLNIKTKNRLSVFIVVTLFCIILFALIFKTLEDNVLYFYSPTEIKESEKVTFNKNIRIGGMVKNGSVETKKNEIKFVVTDYKNEIIVSYKGTVPALFAEGKGVVAEGYLNDRRFFDAKKILAKHDENYMPPEVKEALENKK